MVSKTKTSKVSKQVISNDIPENIDQNMIIPVLNGFHGQMIYVSSKTGEKFEWGEFGDIQEMELKELRVAKNSAKGFFANNWFMFDDEFSWVIKYLGVSQYYDTAISMDGFNELLTKTPKQISDTISEMTDGQKYSLSYMAREKYNNGEIDSIKTVAALEESLGIKLTEK